MSQLIKDLATQAGAETWSRSPMRAVTGVAFTDENLEKFAKLIAAECMKVAIFRDDGMIATAQIAGYMAAGRSTAAKMIKEHFEVE
jgi:hypothetical protein